MRQAAGERISRDVSRATEGSVGAPEWREYLRLSSQLAEQQRAQKAALRQHVENELSRMASGAQRLYGVLSRNTMLSERQKHTLAKKALRDMWGTASLLLSHCEITGLAEGEPWKWTPWI